MGKINYSKSFENFLHEKEHESRICRLLIMAHHQYLPVYDLIVTDKNINHITFRNDGRISYLPAGKPHVELEGGIWARAGRQMGKPGKVIRKIFTEKALKVIKDSEFEIFNNTYKGRFNTDGMTFNLLPASEIPDIYDGPRGPGQASLNSSCMNGVGEEGYLEIYTECKSLQILTLWKEKQLIGRCLIWKTTLADKEIVVADRFYVAEDFMYNVFVEKCIEEGWYYKSNYKSYDDREFFIEPSTGNRIILKLVIKTPTDFDKYPYMDTMQFGGQGYIQNFCGDAPFEYHCTGGGREGDDHRDEGYDQINGDWIDADDLVMIGRGSSAYRNHETHRDYTVMINHEVWCIYDDRNICETAFNGHQLKEDCIQDYRGVCYLKVTDHIGRGQHGRFVRVVREHQMVA